MAWNEADFWGLDGKLEDGRPILANRLFLTGSSTDILMRPYDSTRVELGVRGHGPINSASYPLAGMYYRRDYAVKLGDCEFTINHTVGQSENMRAQARAIGHSLEGKTLTLSSLPNTFSEKHCFEQAYIVTRLLTLASGEGVAAHRQIINWKTGEELEIWRSRVDDKPGPGELIPHFFLEQFLTGSFDKWESWSKKKQDLVTRALSYLNMSTHGYLDIRLLHIMQTLESLANAWVERPRLPREAKQLEKALKSTYREWLDAGAEDPKGFLGSRVGSIFSWPKLLNKLTGLFSSRGINLVKTQLDLSFLRDARNGVAHYGILPEEIGSDNLAALHQLQAGQLAIQLLLLSELGYTGKIYDRRSSELQIVRPNDFAL